MSAPSISVDLVATTTDFTTVDQILGVSTTHARYSSAAVISLLDIVDIPLLSLSL